MNLSFFRFLSHFKYGAYYKMQSGFQVLLISVKKKHTVAWLVCSVYASHLIDHDGISNEESVLLTGRVFTILVFQVSKTNVDVEHHACKNIEDIVECWCRLELVSVVIIDGDTFTSPKAKTTFVLNL